MRVYNLRVPKFYSFLHKSLSVIAIKSRIFFFKLKKCKFSIRVVERSKGQTVNEHPCVHIPRNALICISFNYVFSHVDRGLMIGRSPFRGLLRNFFKVFIVSEFILNWNKIEDLTIYLKKKHISWVNMTIFSTSD
jgi:hypothetical protein